MEKALEIAKSKDSSSKEYFIKLYGDDWEYHYNEKNMKTSHSLECVILRYGESIGRIKYEEFCNNKFNTVKEKGII